MRGHDVEPRDDEFEDLCVQAVEIASRDLGLDPGALVAELAHGEIGLLITYLRAAAPSVGDPELRANVDALLHRLTAWTRRAE